MEKNLYPFNASQDVINLQTKYSLFSRVSNILFSVSREGGFDRKLMTQAVNLVIERNDCLRITFVKKKKKIYQYFKESRKICRLPFRKFNTKAEMEAFLQCFRKTQANCFTGEGFQPILAVDPDGNDMLIVKISHYIADTYGIVVIINDLFGVYDALKNGTPLPEAPGSFEEVLKRDIAYKDNEEAVARDRAFFEEYYTKKHSQCPMYCGIHGKGSEIWMKHKRKGEFSMPYFFVKCDTQGYRYVIPKSVCEKVEKWCETSGITMSSFFMYSCAIAASLLNDKEKYQIPLELLNCRGTVAERKAAGTKVQAVGVYTTVDYERSFNENIADFFADQNDIFRHTKLTYLDVEAIQHKLWNYSLLRQITNFSYSFIPMTAPEGVTMTLYSNGKGALVTYLAMMYDTKTKEVSVSYDIQTKMVSRDQLIEFHNTIIRVAEAVTANPDTKLNQIF